MQEGKISLVCVHGHQDCDAPHLQPFSPTPMIESLYLFLLIALGLSLSMDFAHVKNFCVNLLPCAELEVQSMLKLALDWVSRQAL